MRYFKKLEILKHSAVISQLYSVVGENQGLSFSHSEMPSLVRKPLWLSWVISHVTWPFLLCNTSAEVRVGTLLWAESPGGRKPYRCHQAGCWDQSLAPMVASVPWKP